nr:MAG TPA: hypothetical protein [Caudoviricetes sp.]
MRDRIIDMLSCPHFLLLIYRNKGGKHGIRRYC